MGAGGLFWLWSQATALPEWYDDDVAIALELEDSGEGPGLEPATSGWRVMPVEEGRGPPAPSSVPVPRRRELRNFHVQALAREKAFRQAVRGSRAVYEDGHLELGVVLDTGKIPRAKLRANGRSLYDRAAKAFPGARNRRIYVGISDEPASAEGYLQLGSAPQVRVGNLSYSLGKASKKLGLPPARLRRDLNRLFRQLKLMDPDAAPR